MVLHVDAGQWSGFMKAVRPGKFLSLEEVVVHHSDNVVVVTQ